MGRILTLVCFFCQIRKADLGIMTPRILGSVGWTQQGNVITILPYFKIMHREIPIDLDWHIRPWIMITEAVFQFGSTRPIITTWILHLIKLCNPFIFKRKLENLTAQPLFIGNKWLPELWKTDWYYSWGNKLVLSKPLEHIWHKKGSFRDCFWSFSSTGGKAGGAVDSVALICWGLILTKADQQK